MFRPTSLAVAAIVFAAPALAQEMSPAEQAHMLRNGIMHNLGFNLGPLSAMAKGEAEYNADEATLRANNLVALASVDLSPYWVEGSSSEELEDSRALPAIWENMDDVNEKHMALLEASQALASAAGESQEALAAAMQDVGESCGGCHEDFRVKKD